MNILWDFRLFSTGYKNRGIGNYTKAVASLIYERGLQGNLFILGNKADLPEELKHWKCTYIEYGRLNWKKDLLKIPFIIKKYKIDLIHYWVGLGPLYQIGFGLFHTCSSCATIYDMGVELWDLPHLHSVKRSWYWRFQKHLFTAIKECICISDSSKNDLLKIFPKKKESVYTVYFPVLEPKLFTIDKREPFFITLGGSIHKNCGRVAAAFSRIRKDHPEHKLIILGEVNPIDENLQHTGDTIFFEESMQNYESYLRNSQGLIFASLYEGLGIPPLEALAFGCPLLVSKIPSLLETCHDAAYFADPLSEISIDQGIRELIKNNQYWMKKSIDGRSRYLEKCRDLWKKIAVFYKMDDSGCRH
ncbi:MAG: glycosyltransferase family 4 protein [Fibrobacter sp.]|nr:glycosyltransferase family 4 protein [Fibrobacter sp.]